MEFSSYHDFEIVRHALQQLIQSCDLIMEWNKNVFSTDDYTSSPEGMQKMAASCMLIESIGEGVKKIDKHMPDLLQQKAPTTPWKEIKGLRDHIAHGYFNLDAEIIFDVAINEIPGLKDTFQKILISL